MKHKDLSKHASKNIKNFRHRKTKVCGTYRLSSFVPTGSQVNPTNTTIPAYPVFIEDGGTTSLAIDTPGSVGILLNGVALFR